LPVAAALLTGGTIHLGWQAYAACFPLASDPRNPYVYAHTGRDVFEIAGRVKELAGASPEGPARVQIMSGENLWPLPFYLRGMPGIEWWNGVPEGAEVATAPIVVVTPDLEEALTRRLYDLPPPGERDLYVSLFPRPVFLRPGVELRGYGTSRLVEEARSRGASAEAGPGSRE
jgi:hypothetical protein